ncbi:MAG TPA: right-handed parallel beta-helix repeat-containing protein, partial [Herpetosiphonaceae bacterium]|nr:right-handed parallel beta-helix repeat-containing protein [Herpetosiphonaceae bacterium]
GDRSGIRNAEIKYGVGYGVKIEACDYGFVEWCYVHHNGLFDLYSEGNSTTTTRYARFDDCVVHSYGFEAGIHHRGNAGLTATTPNYAPMIRGCYCKRFDNSGGPGSARSEICIEVWGHTYDAVISSNHAEGGWMGISVDRSRYAAVTGNTVRDCRNGYELAASERCTVTGNTYQGLNKENTIGVSCSNSPNGHNVISGNYFYGFAECGIHLNGSTGDTSNWYTITGNQFYPTIGTADCIRLQHASYVTITGNSFFGDTAARGDGIHMDSHSSTGPNMPTITITGNTFADLDRCFDFQASGTVGTATPSVDRVSVTGNTFTNNNLVIAALSSGKINNVYIGDNWKMIGNIGLGDYRNYRAGTVY